MRAADNQSGGAGCIDPRLVARAGEVIERLRRERTSVITAESCTAGLIAAVLSQADGAGEILHGSFVTYSKAHKTAALGVPAALLESRGSVNEEVARAMAEGALTRSPADLTVAVTGVLGPEPDEDGNPVGLVYLCCRSRAGDSRVSRADFGKQPHDVLRYQTVMAALDLLAAS
ncbi:MAG TPA: CinA family protein [Rhizomicrobium sp.]